MLDLSNNICQYVLKFAVKLTIFHYVIFFLSCVVLQGNHDGINSYCIVFINIGEKAFEVKQFISIQNIMSKKIKINVLDISNEYPK